MYVYQNRHQEYNTQASYFFLEFVALELYIIAVS